MALIDGQKIVVKNKMIAFSKALVSLHQIAEIVNEVWDIADLGASGANELVGSYFGTGDEWEGITTAQIQDVQSKIDTFETFWTNNKATFIGVIPSNIS